MTTHEEQSDGPRRRVRRERPARSGRKGAPAEPARAVRPRAATGSGRARPAAGGGRTPEGRKVVILSVITVLVVVIGIGAFVLGQGAVSTGKEAKKAQPDTATRATTPAADLTTFEDKGAGFTIQYPKTWQKYDAPVRDLALVVTPGGQDYVSVRVQRTDTPTTPQNLGNLKAVTDGVVGSNDTVKVLDQKAVNINGLIGYYYLYTFTDKSSGLQGAHAHYFLFQGNKMNSLVFQALPTEGYKALEPTFDQILSSFHSDPEPAGSPAPSAPAPAPPTTVP